MIFHRLFPYTSIDRGLDKICDMEKRNAEESVIALLQRFRERHAPAMSYSERSRTTHNVHIAFLDDGDGSDQRDLFHTWTTAASERGLTVQGGPFRGLSTEKAEGFGRFFDISFGKNVFGSMLVVDGRLCSGDVPDRDLDAVRMFLTRARFPVPIVVFVLENKNSSHLRKVMALIREISPVSVQQTISERTCCVVAKCTDQDVSVAARPSRTTFRTDEEEIRTGLLSLNRYFELPSVTSRRQFAFLVRGDPHRLRAILSRNGLWKVKGAVEGLERVVYDSVDMVDDAEIYLRLRNYLNNVIRNREEYQAVARDRESANINIAGSGDVVTARAKARLSEVTYLLPPSFNAKRVLDLGCAEGQLTDAFAAAFSIPASAVHGCDVREITVKESSFTFTLYDGHHLPYESGSFSLVTALMAFHHIPHAGELIDECRRVLEDGGLLLLREHDCDCEGTAVVLDVLHGFYSLVSSDPMEMPDFCLAYEACYRSREFWTSLVESHGFERMRSRNADAAYNKPAQADRTRHGPVKNPFRFFYGLYRKLPSSVQQASMQITTSNSLLYPQGRPTIASRLGGYAPRSQLSSRDSFAYSRDAPRYRSHDQSRKGNSATFHAHHDDHRWRRSEREYGSSRPRQPIYRDQDRGYGHGRDRFDGHDTDRGRLWRDDSRSSNASRWR